MMKMTQNIEPPLKIKPLSAMFSFHESWFSPSKFRLQISVSSFFERKEDLIFFPLTVDTWRFIKSLQLELKCGKLNVNNNGHGHTDVVDDRNENQFDSFFNWTFEEDEKLKFFNFEMADLAERRLRTNEKMKIIIISCWICREMSWVDRVSEAVFLHGFHKWNLTHQFFTTITVSVVAAIVVCLSWDRIRNCVSENVYSVGKCLSDEREIAEVESSFNFSSETEKLPFSISRKHFSKWKTFFSHSPSLALLLLSFHKIDIVLKNMMYCIYKKKLYNFLV